MTYLLDTNVISELRKLGDNRCDPNVARWISEQDARLFYLSAITILELERGVLGIERRDRLQGQRLRQWLEGQVRPAFADHILPVDDAIATACAHLHVPDRRNEVDSLIAATAIVRGLVVVTRNTDDFKMTGAPLLNPWLA